MLKGILLFGAAILVLGFTALAQNPAPDAKHFDKDGLSFDYPANWQLSDQSTAQMQVLEFVQGDLVVRVRAPREWLRSPAKEAEAKRLIQDKYVDGFVESLLQAGLKPIRSNVSSEIAGAPAEGLRVRAVLGQEPGGMDSYFRVISDRFVQLSRLGSEADMTKFAAAWDMLRNSIRVAPPPELTPPPQTTPKPSPSPGKP